MPPYSARVRTIVLFSLLGFSMSSSNAEAADDTLLIIEEDETQESDTTKSEGLVIEDAAPESGAVGSVTPAESQNKTQGDEEVAGSLQQPRFSFKVDKLWSEFGQFTDSDSGLTSRDICMGW